jgi:uroporphyrinogen III methyltransferase/synthase
VLTGRTVVVTRASGQAGELSALLRERGAKVVEIPSIEIVAPASWEEADRAIERLPGYDWLILTSPNAVASFFGRLRERGVALSCLADLKICAIGPKTRALVEAAGLAVAFTPKVFRAEALVAEAGTEAWRGKRVLFPRAAEGREVIPVALAALGATLELVTVYRTVPSAAGRAQARALLAARGADAVTFTSGSTVTGFAALFDPGELPGLLRGVAVASIGPVTTEAARAAGLAVDVTAAAATIPALVEALEDHFRTP